MTDDPLFPEHRRELETASAVHPDVIAERGYRTIGRPSGNDNRPREELRRLGIPTWATNEDRYFPGLLIPMYRATGERITWQFKPRIAPPGAKPGKTRKYASVKGQANRIDVHPRNRNRIADPTEPLVITEGVKKADALTSAGKCVIALTGVFNWRTQLGTLGDWEDIPLRGRQVVVCFDADARSNPNVLRAMRRLGAWLKSKGSKPYYLITPDETNGQPVKGVDEYLAAGGSLQQLKDQVTDRPPELDQNDKGTFTDARMAEVVAEQVLAGNYLWVRQFGWMAYNGRVWAECSDAAAAEAVRQFFVDRFAEEAANLAANPGADPAALDGWRSLMSRARQNAVLTLCRGLVERTPADFDQERDLLNTPTGVVDLRTGELLPHDGAYLFTKVTGAGYDPQARHGDWNKALAAVPEHARGWLQIRLGQATSGYMTPDDVLVVQQGSGENGKTTLTAAVQQALGGYATLVSHRALLANPDTHPTELMDFYGARFAILEETPEARRLSVVRLKQTVGTVPMKSRRMHKDPIEWDPTHSLFLSTNYLPQVDETDHGTWRRLALLRYPYTFRKQPEQVVGPNDRLGDPGLRERCRQDSAAQRAILAWLVDGARQWYAAGRVVPPPPVQVQADTLAWRCDADRILAFWTDKLIDDPDACVIAEEMLGAFNEWLDDNGHRRWAKETFTPRFAQHDTTVNRGVEQRRTAMLRGVSRWSPAGLNAPRSLKSQETVWLGVRFKTASDQEESDTVAEVADQNVNPTDSSRVENLPSRSAISASVDEEDQQPNGQHRPQPSMQGPGSACARWLGTEHQWCGRTDNLRRYQVGMLCPDHAPKPQPSSTAPSTAVGGRS